MITAIQNISSDAGSWAERQQRESDVYNKQYMRRLNKQNSEQGYKLIESFSVSLSSAFEDIVSGAAKAPSALPFII